MAAKNSYTIEEKLAEVERLLDVGAMKMPLPGTEADARRDVLKAIASDLRSRLDHVPSAALTSLMLRIVSAERTKTRLGYSASHMAGIAQVVIGAWPTLRQALELFGALVETGEPPLKAAFDLGFEHAVDGGHESAKKAGMIPGHLLPIVMYFTTEEDRREMIDAVHIAKPNMVTATIPRRSKP